MDLNPPILGPEHDCKPFRRRAVVLKFQEHSMTSHMWFGFYISFFWPVWIQMNHIKLLSFSYHPSSFFLLELQKYVRDHTDFRD